MNISDTQVAGELSGLLNLLSKLEIVISLKKLAHVKYKGLQNITMYFSLTLK